MRIYGENPILVGTVGFEDGRRGSALVVDGGSIENACTIYSKT